MVGVILKQRPQASPKSEVAPNESVLTAAVYPDDILPPHAEKKKGRGADQHGLREAPKYKIDAAELTGFLAAVVLSEGGGAFG